MLILRTFLPNLSKIVTFAATPLVLTPFVRNQGIFDRILGDSGGFAVPEAGLSVADLLLFCSLNSIRSGFVEGLGPDLFKDYGNIMRHKDTHT